MIRLNKFLSEAGICSRREADRLIEAGRVSVNGKRASVGERVEADWEILVDGKRARKKQQKTLLAFYKPRGIVCTFERRKGQVNIIDFLDYPIRLTYAGRLDKDSEGLIILTDDGELIHRMMRGANGHEKEYTVEIDKQVTEDFLEQMQKGIPILGKITRPCKAWKTGEKTFRIILTQGMNRQIRRMCEYLDCRVVKLKRIRIMNIELGDLKPGEYRLIEGKDRERLDALLNGTGK